MTMGIGRSCSGMNLFQDDATCLIFQEFLAVLHSADKIGTREELVGFGSQLIDKTVHKLVFLGTIGR